MHRIFGFISLMLVCSVQIIGELRLVTSRVAVHQIVAMFNLLLNLALVYIDRFFFLGHLNLGDRSIMMSRCLGFVFLGILSKNSIWTEFLWKFRWCVRPCFFAMAIPYPSPGKCILLFFFTSVFLIISLLWSPVSLHELKFCAQIVCSCDGDVYNFSYFCFLNYFFISSLWSAAWFFFFFWLQPSALLLSVWPFVVLNLRSF